MTQGLLLSGSSFPLLISPSQPVVPLSVPKGTGVVGGTAGGQNNFSVFFRDLYKNPAVNLNYLKSSFILNFTDARTGDIPHFTYLLTGSKSDYFSMSYSIQKAGTYAMNVYAQFISPDDLNTQAPGRSTLNLIMIYFKYPISI